MATPISASDLLAVFREAGLKPSVVAALKPDVPLLRQGIDSIDLPVIAVAIEKKYGVDFSKADAAKLRTLQDTIAFIEQLRKK